MLNSDKTEITRLNEQHTLNTTITLQTLGSIPIKECIKICGIYFPVQNDSSYQQNITNKIEKLCKQLQIWSSRNLSLEGKNLLVKTFGISQLIHSMQTCNVTIGDLKKIETIIFAFLWSSKCDKIKRQFMFLSKGQGGLGVVDIFSFYKSLKIRRFMRYHNSNTHIASIFIDKILFSAGFRSPLIFLIHKPLIKDIGNQSIQQAITSINFINTRTADLFSKTDLDCTTIIGREVFDSLASYPLFNSPHIHKLSNARDVIHRLSRIGVYSIATLSALRQQDPTCDPCFAVSSAYSVIPEMWKINYIKYDRSDIRTNRLRAGSIPHWGITNDNKILYFDEKTLKANSNLSQLLTRWHRNILPLDKDWTLAKHHFENHHLIDIPHNPFKIPKYFTPYQASFQFRVLHRGVTTRSKLGLYKIIADDETICQHCGEGEDDFYHGLVKCPGSIASWGSLSEILHEQAINLKINVGHVLFGIDTCHPQHMMLNLVMIKMKQILLHNRDSRRFLTKDDVLSIVKSEYKLITQRYVISNKDTKQLQNHWNNMHNHIEQY